MTPPRRVSRWLRLGCYTSLLLSILTTLSAVSSALSSCHSHSGDALLDRVDSHLSTCLPTQSLALDGFKDALNANELEAQAPLALVAFSSSPSQLTRLAVAVATATADVSPAIRVLDFASLLHDSSQPIHALRTVLRSEMAATLSACPQRRTLFVVRGLEAVQGDRLSLLDVFLDPMNGVRALLHDQLTGRDLDCRRALFVFLYQQNTGDSVLTTSTWRDFLVGKWRASAVNDGTQQTEKFTPQALAGRLTVAVQLQAEDEALEPTQCGWDEFLTRLGVARRQEEAVKAKEKEEAEKAAKTSATNGKPTTGVASLGESPWSTARHCAGVFSALLLCVAVLVAAKRFVASSKEMEEVVLIQAARRETRSRSSEKHGDAETATTYSLRSRTVVATTSFHDAEETVDHTKSKPAGTSLKPRKPAAMKRAASARAQSKQQEPSENENENETGAVAPPPTPATGATATPGSTTKSPGKRRARRATRS